MMWCAGAGGGQRTVRRSSSPLPAGQPPTNSLFSAFGSMPATILAAWQREQGGSEHAQQMFVFACGARLMGAGSRRRPGAGQVRAEGAISGR